MTASPVVIFGTPHHGITITIRGRMHGGARDFWDGNWLSATIAARIDNFQANIDAALRAEEFPSFKSQLQALNATLRGEAKFETMEQWITIFLRSGKHGHIGCQGSMRGANSCRMDFAFEIDPTYLPKLIHEIDDVIMNYPVVGER